MSPKLGEAALARKHKTRECLIGWAECVIKRQEPRVVEWAESDTHPLSPEIDEAALARKH